MRTVIKAVANGIAWILTLPWAALCWLELALFPRSERMFGFWSHVFSLLPGDVGAYLRRSFYRQTLQSCSARCFISFGAIFTHREAIVEDGVYVGVYALIGSAHIKQGSLIGSRASLLSGVQLHELRDDGTWTPTDITKLKKISIGPNAWIGEGAIVGADVGAGSLLATGTVVTTAVPANVKVAGNPARFVGKLVPQSAPPSDPKLAPVEPAL